MDRRGVLRRLTFAATLALPARRLWSAPPRFAPVVPRTLVFPGDHGAHPDFRTEWWYATGWLDAGGENIGFQVTFFRSRSGHDADNPSRFAPHQLLFAHAALAQSAHGRLRHEQRAARVVAGDDSNGFAIGDTDLRLRDWAFRRDGDGTYHARIEGDTVKLDLALAPTQPILRQGDAGFSRKGADPEQASYYYSQPQLAVSGRIHAAGPGGQWRTVSGRAWLDHEWSSRVLDRDAAGWDWIGINLDDGGALMAFRIRGRDGSTRWAAARWRDGFGRERSYAAHEVTLAPLAEWRSPRTGAAYPVRQRLSLGTVGEGMHFELAPLLDDQELDSRGSTGAVYWEGAVTLVREGRPVGRGYLELVGYHRPMVL
jgi:predicted secreted hydrolase